MGVPLRIALCTRLAMAVRLARASRQPRRPQPQSGPPALMTMWPISPALSVRPVTTFAVDDQAAADARADERRQDVA